MNKKYAICGLGFIYPRHKQAIEKTGGEIILTCDNDPDKKADFLDWRKMFISERFREVDVVVICTPNDLHSEMAFSARLAGKEVICEKPLVININEIPLVIGVTPVLQLRYHPKVIEAKNRGVKQVDFSITMFREKTYFSGWKGDWKRSGGLLFNLGIHYLDLLVHLLGPQKRITSAKSDIIGYDDLWNEWFNAEIEHERGFSKFFIELCQEDQKGTKKPTRRMTVTYLDGTKEDIELSQKDNLSYEDLHMECYKAFLNGNPLTDQDAIPSLILANDLYKSNVGK